MRRRSQNSRREFLGRVAGLAAALLASACGASFEGYTTSGYTTVQVGPPPAYYAYPSVWYRGSYVYLIDGTWYGRSGARWYRYRDEPRELGRYRRYYGSYGRFPTHVRSRAPQRDYDRAPRGRYYDSPPRRYDAPPRRSSPSRRYRRPR